MTRPNIELINNILCHMALWELKGLSNINFCWCFVLLYAGGHKDLIMYVPLFQDNHITGRRFVTLFERYMQGNKIIMKELLNSWKIASFLLLYIFCLEKDCPTKWYKQCKCHNIRCCM